MLASKTWPLGAVFTPLALAENLVRRFSLASAWRNGATLMDPCAGDGVWFQALVQVARESGWIPAPRDFERLFGAERDPQIYENLRARFFRQGWPFSPERLLLADYLQDGWKLPKVDIGLGNPPWVSFGDLPDAEKERLKPLYRSLGLVDNPRSTLGGGSRIDLSALIVAQFLSQNLKSDGQAVLLLPRSLAISSSHASFRRHFPASRWEKIPSELFPEVGTAIGLGVWSEETSNAVEVEHTWSPVLLPSKSRPRQGVNTQGANKIFFFDGVFPENCDSQLVYPVPTAEQWKGGLEPHRWVVLPYDPRTGRPLPEATLRQDFKRTWEYLKQHEDFLRARRGLLVKKRIESGFWYSLWGVGDYTFAPWKLIWPAYGDTKFRPLELGPWGRDGQKVPWIPQQSLQAYCAFEDASSLRQVAQQLSTLPVEQVLGDAEGGGTPCWAQPGRMKMFFTLEG
ncbi:MAG: hypothetical protein HKM06_06035 [Spirochaetales bacterium]|nr:hypothetical protein [Spirochaetales bacterium]